MSKSLGIMEDSFVNALDRLDILLTNLPSQLPLADNYYDSQYPSFLSFSLDPDTLKKTGNEIATLECEKAICALHGILKLYYEKYPTNNMLKKWVDDITAGGEKVYKIYGVPILDSKEPVKQWHTKHPTPDITVIHSKSTQSNTDAQISKSYVYQPKSSGARCNPNDIMS
ncbi:hypothetical protein BDR04DRAFT_1118474 [Suillus decipiens]|nr:hypothetical protein BDR04DRAFT_1118474 [Suillus decipiens]